MDLRAFPRPKDDNGIGIHFRLELAESQDKPFVSQGVGWLKQIHAKWALVAGQDWNQIARAAGPIWQAGIMPVCRLITQINGPYVDWTEGVRQLQALGIAPYIQVFNEPGDGREWKPGTRSDLNVFGARWADAATRIYDAGGYPGVGAVLGKNEWQASFNAIKERGRMDMWQRTWFAVHNYGSNHPADYPYDAVNQKGTPVSADEYARSQFSLPIDQVNQLRAQSVHAGATVMTDDTTVLRFLEFKSWMVESLGFCLPMIGAEGGWEWGCDEDRRYSKLTPDQHASFHKQVYNWFCTGVLSNGDPLPDELFCFSPWIMADWGADDWWYGPLGTKQGTIDAVASIPPFVRQFSWDRPTPPAPPPPPVTPPPPPPAPPPVVPPPPPQVTYTVQQGETLWGISRKFGTTVDAIAAANGITDPSKIRTGQVLVIPRVTYTVQSGDTVWGISRKFGTTVDAIVAANHLTDPSKIFPGQQLIIPV